MVAGVAVSLRPLLFALPVMWRYGALDPYDSRGRLN